jgi:predicted DNA-binding transcriptional regulator AlpA
MTQEKSYSRVRQVAKRLNMSTSSVWRKVANGTFPKPIKLSEKMTVWDNDVIDAFVDSKK